MNTMRFISAAALALVVVPLASCGGGSGSGGIVPAGSQPGGRTSLVTLHLAVPPIAKSGSSARRRAQFVASTTGGILEQTYAQSDTTHATLLGSTATDISSASTACGGTSGTPRTCTVAFYAPPGADTFVLTSYDAPPVSNSFSAAKILGGVVVNQTIAAGTPVTIAAVLGGIVNSFKVLITQPNIHGTLASTQNVYVQPYDADGNLIVSDSFSDANGNPLSIALTVTPNTGNVFTLGAASLSSPALGGVTLAYSGTAVAGFAATVKAASGTINGTGVVTVLGPQFTSYATVTAASHPEFLSIAPYSSQNYDLWLTENSASKIADLKSNGTMVEYSLGAAPDVIAPGPFANTNLWITQQAANQIEAVDTSGVPHAFIATPTAGGAPFGIVAGPDGNMWFTEGGVGKIGKVTTGYVASDYAVGAGSAPKLIAAGPDGNLWFTDPGTNKIGQMTTAGVPTEFAVVSAASGLYGIAAGADGKLWFTESAANKVGVITTAGSVTEYSIPTAASVPQGITLGPDGAMWFTEWGSGKLGRITSTGTITEYLVPSGGATMGIATGPDNNLWFAQNGVSKVATFAW